VPYCVFFAVLSLEELELAAGAELEEPVEPLAEPLLAPESALGASVLEELLLELGALEELGGVAEELDELEPAGGLLGFTVTEPDVELEPDGGVVGVVVAPLPEVEDEDERSAAGRSGPRSQPPIRVAPSARETATANVENFMRPPWLGTQEGRARYEPRSTV
jgi:hypothetical protein